ncbi:MAG: hypothetical protein H7145_02630 [Akkermansiaceae bacterium]|nr:hypothetical protein [Armatimonadota bacterium]
METRTEHTNRGDWRPLLCFLPQLIAVGLVMFYTGGWLAESWSPWLAYPTAFVIGAVVAIIGTAVFGDFPTTLVEMGCGGVITCVLLAILLPVFAQARHKAREQRNRAAIRAEASVNTGKPSDTHRAKPR